MSQFDLFSPKAIIPAADVSVAGKPWRGYEVSRSALFSPCGTWRYALARVWKPGPIVISAGLNPSTADAFQDDPTIHSESVQYDMMGYGGLLKLNIFAFKSPYPKEMKAAPDPVGPDNNRIFSWALDHMTPGNVFVVGWGSMGNYRDRDLHVMGMLQARKIVPLCFGINSLSGQPRHPLYLPHGAKLFPYSGRG